MKECTRHGLIQASGRGIRLSSIVLGVLFINTLQANSLVLDVEPKQLVLGERCAIHFIIKGQVQSINNLTPPQCPGLEINWAERPSKSNNTTIINGQINQETRLTWFARASKTGTHIVGAASMQVNGQTLTSPPVEVVVSEKQTSHFFHLSVHVEMMEVVEGQLLPLHIDFMVADQLVQNYERVTNGSYRIAGNHYDAFAIPPQLEKDFDVIPKFFDEQISTNGKYFGRSIQNTTHNQFQFRTQRLTLLLKPKRMGRLEIPSLQAFFYDFNQQQTQSFFGMRYELVKSDSPYASQSQPLIINVVQLPDQGRPIEFNGMICESLQVQLSVLDLEPNQTVQLHTPISIHVRVNSDLPAEFLKLPDWNSQEELQKGFDVSTHAALREDIEGGALFKEIVFRPKNVNVKNIPVLNFAYYDPRSKTYKMAHTVPFPLLVESVASVSGDGKSPSINEVVQSVDKPEAITKVARIEGIETSHTRLERSTQDILPLIVFYALALAPWLAMLGLVACKELKFKLQNDASANQHGFAETLKKINSQPGPGQILDALGMYICHRWKIKDPHDIPLASQELKVALLSLMEKLEAAQYAAQHQAVAKIQPEEVQAILRELHKLEVSK